MIHFQFEPDGKIGVHWDEKKRKSSLNTVFHDGPMVSARFIYGSTMTHYGSTTIHHCGATNAHDNSRIRYGASTIQAGSAAVASRPRTNVRDIPGGGGGWGSGGGTVIFSSCVGSGPASTVHPQKYHDFQAPPKN